jgi:hypothetical protein
LLMSYLNGFKSKWSPKLASNVISSNRPDDALTVGYIRLPEAFSGICFPVHKLWKYYVENITYIFLISYYLHHNYFVRIRSLLLICQKNIVIVNLPKHLIIIKLPKNSDCP